MVKKSKEKKVVGQKKVEVAKVSPDKYFVLCSGGLIKDMEELALMLDHISDDEFRHHVNYERNDFCCWLKDVFNEIELAEELGKTKDKKDTQIIILKHIVSKKR